MDLAVDENANDIGVLESALMADIAAAADEQAIEAVRVAALGKKGSVSEMLKTLGSMSPEERQTKGPAINGLKNRVTEALAARKAELRETRDRRAARRRKGRRDAAGAASRRPSAAASTRSAR